MGRAELLPTKQVLEIPNAKQRARAGNASPRSVPTPKLRPPPSPPPLPPLPPLPSLARLFSWEDGLPTPCVPTASVPPSPRCAVILEGRRSRSPTRHAARPLAASSAVVAPSATAASPPPPAIGVAASASSAFSPAQPSASTLLKERALRPSVRRIIRDRSSKLPRWRQQQPPSPLISPRKAASPTAGFASALPRLPAANVQQATAHDSLAPTS